MRDRVIGWAFVAVQAFLLAVLVFVRERDDWPTPLWLEVVAMAIVVGGAVVGLVAARRLGTALTPTPVPRAGAALSTDGCYRYVRHPIYTGVLLIVAGLVLGSGSLVGLALGVAAVVFFTVKSAWEERHLRDAHPGYAAYASATPRFVPRFSPRFGRRRRR